MVFIFTWALGFFNDIYVLRLFAKVGNVLLLLISSHLCGSLFSLFSFALSFSCFVIVLWTRSFSSFPSFTLVLMHSDK